MLTALLPACTVGRLLRRVHRIARLYHIRLGCDCCKQPQKLEEVSKYEFDALDELATTTSESSLDLLADLALKVDTDAGCGNHLRLTTKKDPVAPSSCSSLSFPSASNSSSNSSSKDSDSNPRPPGEMDSVSHSWICKPQPNIPSHRFKDSSSSSSLFDRAVKLGDWSEISKEKYRVLQLLNRNDKETVNAFQVCSVIIILSISWFTRSSIPSQPLL